jgi:hypothetical protein
MQSFRLQSGNVLPRSNLLTSSEMTLFVDVLRRCRRKTCRHVVTLGLSAVVISPLGQASGAAPLPLQYRGLIELDHGSSIQGIPTKSRYRVDFTLDGSLLDTVHTAFENDIANIYGVRGISTIGHFPPPFLSLQFTAETSNGKNPLDLSGLTFAYNDTNGSGAVVRDANSPPDPQAYLCNDRPCITEHVNLAIRDLTPGAPVQIVWFNLYNSTLYNPPLAPRQFILDTSDPSYDFSFADLFLKGPSTLAQFMSYRTPDFKAFVDGVMFEGPNGTLASGRFLSLEYVPGPLPVLGVGAAFGWSRRLRRRVRQTQAHQASAAPQPQGPFL